MTRIAHTSLDSETGYACVIHAGRHELTADESTARGGTDTGPAPYQLLLSGLAACTAITLRMVAARKGWELGSIHVDVELHKDEGTDRIVRAITLTAPLNPLLPNGGGYPVTFLTRNTRSALGATDSYYTTTDDYGDESHYWHGVDVSFNARMRNLSLQGGTSTGRGVGDNCAVETARFGRPQVLIGTDLTPTCNVAEPWLTTRPRRGRGIT